MRKIYISLTLVVVLSLGAIFGVKIINAQINTIAPKIISPEALSTESSSTPCIQVITPAQDPVTGKCKNFPTPCDIPAGWKKVEKCPPLPTAPGAETGVNPFITPGGETGTIPGTPPLPKPIEHEQGSGPGLKQEGTPVPPTVGTETKAVPLPISVNICAVSNDYLKEINILINQADLAKSRGDLETEKNITEKIKMIKEKIETRKKECQNVPQAQISQTPQAPASQMLSQAAQTRQAKTEDFCRMEKQIVAKIEYYKELLSLSPQELEDKGYEKEELGRILGELQNEKAKVHSGCSGQKVGWTISEIKPVAPQKAEEITNYYKEMVASTIEKALPMATQLEQIRQIKEEAGTMVKELIRSQNEISAQKIQPIVERLVVKPGLIETSQDQIKISEQKKVEATVANRPVEILVNPQKLIFKEEGLEVETRLPLNLTSEGSIIGDPGTPESKEIKVAPSQIIEKEAIKNPIDLKMELVKEKDMPVYKVKAVEKKKLLFFIPVNISKEMTIDATSQQATKLSEKKPWWSFLAF